MEHMRGENIQFMNQQIDSTLEFFYEKKIELEKLSAKVQMNDQILKHIEGFEHKCFGLDCVKAYIQGCNIGLEIQIGIEKKL